MSLPQKSSGKLAVATSKASDRLAAPTIFNQITTHGEEKVQEFTELALRKTCMMLGLEDHDTEIQFYAEDLIEKYKYDTLEDILEALKRGRSGDFGKIYGKLNIMVLNEWVQKVLEEKAHARENQVVRGYKDQSEEIELQANTALSFINKNVNFDENGKLQLKQDREKPSSELPDQTQ